VALFYQAFRYGQQLTRSLMEGLGRVYANTLFLGNLFDFLALRPSVADPPDPRPAPRELRQDIRFEGVAFRYAGSDRPVLEGFDLLLPAGRIAAIVGPNGAGKSTLIKLICRFYDPEAGRVTVDGTDIRVLGVNDWRQRLTVLFQSPVRYNATLAENIALGDLAVSPGRQEIEAAAQAAGADAVAAHLPQGYDTLLGKSFAGGTDLSVGEWQRVALARGFLRKAPIIILDEPTSAMDSWAEADWLERFRSLTAGKTAVLVTHRFSTAMCADVIFVMSGGRIVESGTHQDLLAAGGLYAQSWHRQHGPTPAGGVQ
jgi:ATP-binding cassette subfamily B protein